MSIHNDTIKTSDPAFQSEMDAFENGVKALLNASTKTSLVVSREPNILQL